jgi:hypothetical protein
VKRERGEEGDAVPRSATADTVDLTEQVGLATVLSLRCEVLRYMHCCTVSSSVSSYYHLS